MLLIQCFIKSFKIMADQLFWGSDIFAIYPRTLRELLQAEDLAREREGFLQKDVINLPSDFEWKQKVYFRLLEQQKKINAALDRGEELVFNELFII